MDNALLAEESLFGCLLVEPTETINAVREKLRAADISQEYIRAAYTAACSLVSEGASVDPVAIQDRAQKNGTQIDSGIMREAMRLFVTVANVEKLAEVIQPRHRAGNGNDRHPDDEWRDHRVQCYCQIAGSGGGTDTETADAF